MYTEQVPNLRQRIIEILKDAIGSEVASQLAECLTGPGQCNKHKKDRGSWEIDSAMPDDGCMEGNANWEDGSAPLRVRNRTGQIAPGKNGENCFQGGMAGDFQGPVRINGDLVLGPEGGGLWCVDNKNIWKNCLEGGNSPTYRRHATADHTMDELAGVGATIKVNLAAATNNTQVNPHFPDWDTSADSKGILLPHNGVYAYHITAHAMWGSGGGYATTGTGPVSIVTQLTHDGTVVSETRGSLGVVIKAASTNTAPYAAAEVNLCHSGIFASNALSEVHLRAGWSEEEVTGDGDKTKLRGGATNLALAIVKLNDGAGVI